MAGSKSGARRADFSRAGSRETQRALVRAAVSLWRQRGFSETTVVDICHAAGVSKGSFYFYFSRKEDVLNEVGVFSVKRAQVDARELMQGDYQILDVVDEVLSNMGRAMRRNPPDLVLEVILEGSRRKFQASPPLPLTAFGPAFEQAMADGKLPTGVDVVRLAQMAQMVLADCARAWACGALGSDSFETEASRQISILLHGVSSLAGHTVVKLTPTRRRLRTGPSQYEEK